MSHRFIMPLYVWRASVGLGQRRGGQLPLYGWWASVWLGQRRGGRSQFVGTRDPLQTIETDEPSQFYLWLYL